MLRPPPKTVMRLEEDGCHNIQAIKMKPETH